MREVIFRGRKKYDNTIVYGNLCKLIDGVFIVPFESKKAGVIEFISVDPETVQQYTGFKDSFNNSIFEGDTLKEVFYSKDSDDINIKHYKVFYDECEGYFRCNHDWSLSDTLIDILVGEEAKRCKKDQIFLNNGINENWCIIEVFDNDSKRKPHINY